MDDEQAISWSVLTHVHRERSTDWYWAFALITLLGVAASIFFGNYMLAIILFVGMGSIGILAIRGPREHTVRVDKRGVSVDGTLYLYRNMQSFWVEEDVDEPRLFLTTNGLISPHITIPLDDPTHADDIREFLQQFLQEEEQSPHFGEHLAEMFGL